MQIAALLAVYCVVIAAMSMLGGWLPSLVKMTHLRTQLLISFVAGLMLSIATVQLLPHAIEQTGDASWTGGAVLVGVLVMFLMLRTFHVHQHIDNPLRVDPGHDHGDLHDCNHSHAVSVLQACEVSPPKKRNSSWVGMMIGLGVHSLMDGIALGASVVADAGHGAWMGLFGFGTFLAVAMHKPLDSFAIMTTMRATGWSENYQRVINMVFSVFSPLGVILFWMGASRLGMGSWFLGLGLAVSAGFFICIALADLLPEVHFHSHDRLSLTGMLLAGVLLAIAIENLPGHDHSHDHGGEQAVHSPAAGSP